MKKNLQNISTNYTGNKRKNLKKKVDKILKDFKSSLKKKLDTTRIDHGTMHNDNYHNHHNNVQKQRSNRR